MYTSDSFKPLLKRLVQTPENFTPEDLKEALDYIFALDILQPSQLGAFLTALHIHHVERRPELLAAAVQFLRERALKADVKNAEGDFIVEIVGIGGDGHNTFNVSTTAAIVAAGAGARVIKHGSRAATSLSGSADLLESLGCHFKAPDPGSVTSIPRIPFAFFLATDFHPLFAHIASFGKPLPFRTMFHIFGPLVNPARPQGVVLGVPEREFGPSFVKCLREDGVKRALVVCGYENLDEISCAGPTWAWELKDGEITEMTLTPDDFGLEEHPLSTVIGGCGKENAVTFKRLLTSGRNIPCELTPVLDFVLINASALLVVAGLAKDYREGTAMARESIVSGLAWNALETYRTSGQHSQSC